MKLPTSYKYGDCHWHTVEQKRNLLREALRKERLKLIQPPEKCNFSEEHELVTCINKLSELRLAIADFNFANRENEFRRIHTRLEHLSGRLRRLVCSSEQMDEGIYY
nr:unnamed protein product [Callosobruchus analis]